MVEGILRTGVLVYIYIEFWYIVEIILKFVFSFKRGLYGYSGLVVNIVRLGVEFIFFELFFIFRMGSFKNLVVFIYFGDRCL